MSISTGTGKHRGDGHKPTAWSAPGRGKIFDGLIDRFSPNTTRYATITELELIDKVLPSGNVLDVGCGSGRLFLPLSAGPAHQVFGVDNSLSMLSALKEKTDAVGYGGVVVNASALAPLPFDEATFDGVVSIGMVSHYTDWPSVLRHLVPHIKENGVLLFDLSIFHPEKDGFAAASNPSVGAFTPSTLSKTLAGIGLTLERIVPQRFGGSMDATIDWLDPATLTVGTFGDLHTLTEKYVERLLDDATCFGYALKLDIILRDLLAFQTTPPYRPSAPLIVIARKTDSSSTNIPLPRERHFNTDGSLFDELREALSGPEFASAPLCRPFMSYLAVLDPLFCRIGGGRSAASVVFGHNYDDQLRAVERVFRRLASRPCESALRARGFRYYRRLIRRWLSIQQRLT
jgi:SAM-dependent methyltransferase